MSLFATGKASQPGGSILRSWNSLRASAGGDNHFSFHVWFMGKARSGLFGLPRT
jgi:hypothetical protein